MNRTIDAADPAPVGGVTFEGGPREPSPATTRLVITIITALGALLRLAGLGAQPLWLDEVSSLRNALAFGAGGFTRLMHVDQVAPLHAVVMWVFTLLLGTGEAAVRLPSALAAIATVPLVHVVAVRMFGSRRLGLLSAALVAISPFAIYYAQEARMYALLLLATVAYVAIAWPVVARPLRWGELALLTLVTAIGLGMHHYMALVCAAFGLFLLLRGQVFAGRSWAWLGTQIVGAIPLAYWMILTANTVGNPAGNEKPAALLWTPYTVYTFLVGFSLGPSTPELASAGHGVIAVAMRYAPVIALVAAAAAVLIALGLRRLTERPNRTPGLWLVVWLVTPIALAILATFVTHIQFNVRYVIVSFPALAILLALPLAELGLPSPRGRALPMAAAVAGIVLVGCMTVSTVNLFTNPVYAKADVRSLARVLDRAPADVLLVSDNNRVVKVLRYYGGRTPPLATQVDYRYEQTTPQWVWQNVERLAPGRDREIWLIEYRSWEADPHAYLQHQLDRAGALVQVLDWPGVSLRRYRLRAPAAVNG